MKRNAIIAIFFIILLAASYGQISNTKQYLNNISVDDNSRSKIENIVGTQNPEIVFPPIIGFSNGEIALIGNHTSLGLYEKAIFFNFKNKTIYLIIDKQKAYYSNDDIAFDVSKAPGTFLGWEFNYGTKKASIIFNRHGSNGVADPISFIYDDSKKLFIKFDMKWD